MATRTCACMVAPRVERLARADPAEVANAVTCPLVDGGLIRRSSDDQRGPSMGRDMYQTSLRRLRTPSGAGGASGEIVSRR